MNYIYDIETLSNCFTAVFCPTEGDEVFEFVIHESRNDSKELTSFLQDRIRLKEGLIGFNNKFFDWIVMDYYLTLKFDDPDRLARLLYGKAQQVISSQRKSYIKELIPQLDLFLINHFDNKNRSTSLKALQCSMKWHNVQDMPIHHSTHITEDLIEEILSYNRNDVFSTRAFFHKNKDKIDLRKRLTTKFKIKMHNMSDVSMGETIFLKYLAPAMNSTVSDLKQIRGRETSVELKDVIFPYVEFRSPEFKKVHEKFLKTTIGKDQLKQLKEDLDNRQSNDIEEFIDILESLNLQLKTTGKTKAFGARTFIQGIVVDYGMGGVHACASPGVYSSNEEYMIIDSDVKSYYPNLAIRNLLHPRQFPRDIFCQTYENIFNDRVAAQEVGDQATSDGLKLSLNGVFGKSLDRFSPFYDPHFFCGITINGQLLLSMFTEDVLEYIPGAQLIQLNTDGVTFRIPRKDEYRYTQISLAWMKKTKLILENTYYDKMFIRDVNNYLAVKTDGKIKRKGAFEIEKEPHKDPSFPIIPYVVEQYFVHGKKIADTLREHQDLYDFCGRYKASAGWRATYVHLDYDENGNPYERRDDYGKMLRYIPTTTGGVGIKQKGDKIQNLLSGRRMVCFNSYFELDRSLIDFTFFEWQCQKLIESVMVPQMTLV